MNGYQFEIYKDRDSQYRFRLRAPNGEIILVSEAYTQKHNATKTIKSIQKNAADATVKGKFLAKKGEN